MSPRAAAATTTAKMKLLQKQKQMMMMKNDDETKAKLKLRQVAEKRENTKMQDSLHNCPIAKDNKNKIRKCDGKRMCRIF